MTTELETLVDGYLNVLSQASKRQLVLAAYHICTQVYPDKFLALSLSQRNVLQKKLRELGDRIQPQFGDKWSTAKRLSLQPAEDDGLAVIRQLFLEAASARESPDSPDPERGQQDEKPDRAEESPAAKRSQQKLLAEMQTLISSERLNIDREPVEMELPEPNESSPMQPAQLMRRQILIEKGIRDVLKSVSERANEVLQKANVVPEIPQALLAAAADSEHLGQIPMKTPNLVRLAIKIMHEPPQEQPDNDDDESTDLEADDEARSEQWPDEAEISAAIITGEETAEAENESDNSSGGGSMFIPKFLQLDSLPDFVMIHLRLSDIEFAETNVAVWRGRIRKKMGHLKQVGHAYKESERQLAIAQAEDAWRASWTND